MEPNNKEILNEYKMLAEFSISSDQRRSGINQPHHVTPSPLEQT